MRSILIAVFVLIGAACCSPADLHNEEGTFGIVDGKTAKISKYPYVVSVSIHTSILYIMGEGVILNENWILTCGYVSHFCQNQTTTVRAGSNRWQSGGQTVQVEKMLQHPKYKGSWEYDVAVMKLETPLKLGKKVQPISLSDKKLSVGTTGDVLGWGRTLSNGVGPSKYLKVAQNTVLDDDTCKQAYTTNFGPTLFCSKVEEEGPNFADFGGPFVVKNILYGLFAGGKSTRVNPRLYVNIPELADWIEEAIKS